MTIAWSPADIVRSLPQRVTPMQDETVDSFIVRLAQKNVWSTDDLREYVAHGAFDDVPVIVDRLSAISGVPTRTLCHAMPELCPLRS
jgi:hypothetical protein